MVRQYEYREGLLIAIFISGQHVLGDLLSETWSIMPRSASPQNKRTSLRRSSYQSVNSDGARQRCINCAVASARTTSQPFPTRDRPLPIWPPGTAH